MEVILSTLLTKNNNKKINVIEDYLSSLSIEMIEKIKKADAIQIEKNRKKTIWERRMNNSIQKIDTYFELNNNIKVLTPTYNRNLNKKIIIEYTFEN